MFFPELDPARLALWLPLLLYAEVHYRLRLLPNRLYMRQPEILFDAPARLDPGRSLPLLLIVKDGHLFPLQQGRVEILCHGQGLAPVRLQEELPDRIDGRFWHQLYHLPLPAGFAGDLVVECRLHGRVNQREVTVVTDNYRRTTHAPLRVAVDPDPLPGADWYRYGDLHYHSHLTNDQVEFGAPIDAAVEMARAQGFSFLAVTDHSYDLDDRVDDYLKDDPNLPKWRELQATVARLNRETGFELLAGEELSVGNSRGGNVHMLILNNEEFFVGHGDSAERWFHNRPSSTIPEVLARLQRRAVALAAHPLLRPSTLERWLFRRDHWSAIDMARPGLEGLQVWNGITGPAFDRGMAAWRERLLAGDRPALVGGNDSHGNFNRCRQIRIPFWSIEELPERGFGRVRTGLLREAAGVDGPDLINALRRGAAMVSNGPAARLQLIDAGGHLHLQGDTAGSCAQLRIEAASSRRFGPIETATLYIGDLDLKKEIRKTLLRHPSDDLHYTHRIDDPALPRRGYVRLQIGSRTGRSRHGAWTAPVFIDG